MIHRLLINLFRWLYRKTRTRYAAKKLSRERYKRIIGKARD